MGIWYAEQTRTAGDRKGGEGEATGWTLEKPNIKQGGEGKCEPPTKTHVVAMLGRKQ